MELGHVNPEYTPMVSVSGYTVDYQPIRQVLNQPTVTKMQLSCALHDKDDENEKCWALVTILGDNDFNECGTRDDGVSYCKTFDEFQLKGCCYNIILKIRVKDGFLHLINC